MTRPSLFVSEALEPLWRSVCKEYPFNDEKKLLNEICEPVEITRKLSAGLTLASNKLDRECLVYRFLKENAASEEDLVNFVSTQGTSVCAYIKYLASLPGAAASAAGAAMAAGFTASGVGAGTWAAGWMASIGNVAAGSTFAALQAFGATLAAPLLAGGAALSATLLGAGFTCDKLPGYTIEHLHYTEDQKDLFNELCPASFFDFRI